MHRLILLSILTMDRGMLAFRVHDKMFLLSLLYASLDYFISFCNDHLCE